MNKVLRDLNNTSPIRPDGLRKPFLKQVCIPVGCVQPARGRVCLDAGPPGGITPGGRPPGGRPSSKFKLPSLWTHRRLWNHYLPVTLLEGGNYKNVLTSAENCEFKKMTVFLESKLHLLHATFETHKSCHHETDLLRNVGNVSINVTQILKMLSVSFTFDITYITYKISSFTDVKRYWFRFYIGCQWEKEFKLQIYFVFLEIINVFISKIMMCKLAFRWENLKNMTGMLMEFVRIKKYWLRHFQNHMERVISLWHRYSYPLFVVLEGNWKLNLLTIVNNYQSWNLEL